MGAMVHRLVSYPIGTRQRIETMEYAITYTVVSGDGVRTVPGQVLYATTDELVMAISRLVTLGYPIASVLPA